MKFIYFAIASLALAGANASAERWYLAAEGDKMKSFVDFDSYTAVGAMIRVQVLDIYPQGSARPTLMARASGKK